MKSRRIPISRFSLSHVSISQISISQISISQISISQASIKLAGLIGLGLALCSPSYGETFSVSTSAALRTALQAAQNNGSLDTIILQPGTYSTEDGGPFIYDSPEGYDLTLVGRESDPASVVISGDTQQGEVLVLHNQQAGGTFTLRGLTIVGGSQAFRTENAATRIEYCAFSGPELPGSADTAPGEEVTILSSVFMGADKTGAEPPAENFEPANHKSSGWVLLGSSRSINNMKLFDHYQAVWAYQDGQWRAYSADPAIKARIRARNIRPLNRIPPNSGFWVWRR